MIHHNAKRQSNSDEVESSPPTAADAHQNQLTEQS